MIIDRLISKIIETESPIVVGLDPKFDMIPDFIKEKYFREMGKTPEAAAKTFLEFAKNIIDSIHDLVPAVKPQIAMYEEFGSAGIEAYAKIISYAQSKGLIVIGDIKRGDIASTAECYSAAHIGRVKVGDTSHKIFNSDFITVNPYMGFDSIQPYFGDCKEYDKGLFALLKTSNPGSKDIQDILTQDGKPLYQHVGNLINEWGSGFIGNYGYSSIGAVVGATHPEEGEMLRKKLPHTFFLVPGYGAQGGTGKDLTGMTDKNGIGIIVNSSRGITGAYKTEKYKDYPQTAFADAAREAVIDMKKDLMENKRSH